jgi:hypothetical protein
MDLHPYAWQIVRPRFMHVFFAGLFLWSDVSAVTALRRHLTTPAVETYSPQAEGEPASYDVTQEANA